MDEKYKKICYSSLQNTKKYRLRNRLYGSFYYDKLKNITTKTLLDMFSVNIFAIALINKYIEAYKPIKMGKNNYLRFIVSCYWCNGYDFILCFQTCFGRAIKSKCDSI